MKKTQLLGWILGLSLGSVMGMVSPTRALPPPEDPPEEVLRTQIILEARSPVDGKPLTPAEYAQLKEQLAQTSSPQLSDEVRNIIFLLQLRKFFDVLTPF